MGKVIPQRKSGKGFKIPGKVIQWQFQSWKWRGKERERKAFSPSRIGSLLTLQKTSRNESNYSNYSLLTAVKFFYSCNFGVVWSVGSLCEVIPISKVMVNIYAEERGKILHCFVFSYFKQINWKVQVFRHANKFKQLVISKKKSFKKHLN